MKEKDNQFLATEPIGKLMFKLALPAVAAQLINMLYNLVDRVYIGHIPETGSLALTGLGVCMPVIIIVSAFASLASMGGAPKASIFMGKGDNETASRILGNCFVMQAVVSAVLTAVLLIWNRDLLLLFGASENTIEYAAGYMNIYAVGTLFVQLTLGMNAFISAQGFAKTAMLSVLIGAICNIALDPVFIFGLGMGVRGAALATILSQMASCVWVLAFLRGEKTILRLEPRFMRPDGKIILSCVALGLSPFIMQASESIVNICFNTSLRAYGGDLAVGAMTILASVMQFSMLPLQGLAQGSIPITSYNFGARNPGRVKKSFLTLLKVSLIYSVSLWAVVMLFPQLFAQMFTADAQLIEFSVWAVRIYAAGMVIFGAQLACQMTFIATNNAVSSIVVAIVRKFVLLIPLIYLLPALFENKVFAVYLAEPVADVIAVTFTVVLFAFQFRKALKKLREGPQLAVPEENV